MQKNFLFYFFFLTLAFTAPIFSEIKTKEDADSFLNTYCIRIVNEIEKSYLRQLKAANSSDWETFGKEGAWIGGLSDIYTKLCKN
ncbi:hypothetical protein [Prochlorococcus marinus]|uniref:hypothetical protein n=1 Tax=Prochlorococcus marinus TaxID=1219 RepID=UPI001ADA23D0|nr:hypothetical protein [Prochlorococcus marinus]MBO8204264.1 hypothetical protein [Prochlorococcus marinus CUG1415]MBW3043565.1 hypothetical protein [Prochlorococcus marinus str. MU1415]